MSDWYEKQEQAQWERSMGKEGANIPTRDGQIGHKEFLREQKTNEEYWNDLQRNLFG